MAKRVARVFRATGPEEARGCLVNPCRERNIKITVKSTPMATEEIYLDRHLGLHHIRFAETGLEKDQRLKR